ncbi:FAD-dependent oxidoreductase [Gordonia otitidis]|uniref:flavin monoamine oxidase family protein n=1 Tax=Gordonia otitidis TaxID=249058 RepID=UPI001D13A32D|nr:NAD(P)/FAD-dependent oxidoreductase [Gordonia otitidis]UEA61159.1 FAD-dependent oxidoreductase [Gordonia otitidis]
MESSPIFAASDYDAVVVGAGIAGLTVARLLTRAGARTVVLEARDRVGGRVHSDRSDGTVTDRGASWIHGIADAPLHATTEAFGMRTVEFTVGSYQPDGRPIAYYAPDGIRLDDASAASFAADVHAFDDALSTYVSSIGAGVSYGAATETTLSGLGWDSARTERVREFVRHRTEEQYGVWIDDLDAHGLDDDETDGDEVVFPDGYDQLATRLAEGVHVVLDQTVSRVAWSAEDGATVTTTRGDSVSAVRAVVTVPVGVLKAGAVAFEPPLAEPVAGALDRLEMNTFEKVFLRFGARFWDDGVYAIRRQGPAARWWHSWYDLTALHGQPTLLTFAAGPCALAIRDWSDAQIVASVLDSLREIYGAAVTDPVRSDVTRWQDDPYARGSYAYMTVGSTTADHDDLATPLGGGVLQLAGEATWTDDPATVTAALESGRRAASNILGRDVDIAELWA